MAGEESSSQLTDEDDDWLDDMRQFANMLLQSGDEDASFGQLVDRNGMDILKWMSQVGAISDTQYQSAFDSKGNLTAEAKNDLQKVLYQAVFKGGSQQMEEAFDKLPAKAQRAILSTAFRDMDSPLAGKMLPEIQASIIAFNHLMQNPVFAEAKKLDEVLRAVETFKATTAFDDRLESHNPSDNFSNFALHLAALYKAADMSQSTIAGYFTQMYDLAQGKKAATLFEDADKTKYPLADVIKKVLNIDYKPAKNGNNNVANGGADVALRNQVGRGGEFQGNEPPASGEQTPAGAEPTDRGTGAADDSRGGGTPQQDRADKKEEVRSLTTDEAIECVADMEHDAPVAQQMPLTVENWDNQFPDGIVTTPIGKVKMGEHQFLKLMREGRNSKLGMIRPTFEHPYIIVEVDSEAKEGDTAERPTSYIFIKSFKKADGSRYYYFTSISVSKDGMEVVVSNQEKSRNKILRLLTEGSVIWRAPKDAATASVEQQGLEYVQSTETETATNGSGITPQSTSISSAKPVSASSSDIETKPEGKRNGTATPQSELYSEGKDNKSLTEEQISSAESSSQASESEVEIDPWKPEDRVKFCKLPNKERMLDVAWDSANGFPAVIVAHPTVEGVAAEIIVRPDGKSWRVSVVPVVEYDELSDKAKRVLDKGLPKEKQQEYIDRYIPKELQEYFESGQAMRENNAVVRGESGYGPQERLRDEWV